MNKNLILLQLNEINFNLAKKYAFKYNLKYLKSLIEQKNSCLTSSEKKYELLEPWIQWFSVYSGKKAEDHGIFRLGDCAKYKEELLFNKIEKLKFTVGLISPMNLINNLLNPCYFIPDPWTNSLPDNSFWSKKISSILKITVNNNSGNILTFSILKDLILIFFKFASVSKLHLYFYYALTSLKYKWRKALFLDLLIHDINLKLIKNNSPNFASVFFNGGAHIQHHHLLKSEFVRKNNKVDPIYEAYFLYNIILKDYLNKQKRNYDYIIYTGLSQDINNNPEYYYRLKNHKEFLNYFEINYSLINPRMSRDFEIQFDNQDQAEKAAKDLSKIRTADAHATQIFKTIDIRNKSIFVTLTYPKKISKNLLISNQKKSLNFFDNVNFVAEKNGIHSQTGYLFYSKNLSNFFGESDLNVKDVYNIILNYFNA